MDLNLPDGLYPFIDAQLPLDQMTMAKLLWSVSVCFESKPPQMASNW